MPGAAPERQRIRDVIQRAGVAMLMTVDDRGVHAGRPMLPLLLDDDPAIYFLTHGSSRKVTHVAAGPQVALTISDAECYLSIAGRADVSRDAGLIARLWRPTYRAWFPGGVDDPEAAVLRILVDRIDYWEPPRSRLTRVFQAALALVTRRPVETPMQTIDGL